MKKSRPPKKIGLLGPFGFGNLGDGAIQQAMVEHIRKYIPEAQIYGFSLNPKDTEERHGIHSYLITQVSEESDSLLGRIPRKIRYHRVFNWIVRIVVKTPAEIALTVRSFNVLKGFDLLIVSGGGQLDDYWGGTWRHPFTLFKWAVIAKLRRTSFLFVSVGAERLDAALSRFFVKKALSIANYRSYRDEKSKSLIQKIGFNNQIDPVYPDLAYSLNLAEYSRNDSLDRSRPIVGIGPMAYCHPNVWPKRDELAYKTYLRKLVPFVLWLVQRGYQVLFFTGQSVHDRWAIHDLREMLNEQNDLDLGGATLEPDIRTVDELMAQLSMAEIVVASRLHGVLLSHLLSKPVLAISYDEKIKVLMDNLGQSVYCLDIEQFDVGSLKDKFISIESNREAIASRIAECVRAYRCALDEQYDRLFRDQ